MSKTKSRISKARPMKPKAAGCAPSACSASGPKFKVGDRVSVPARFGETGTVKELKDGRYGVAFRKLPFTLWYDENELLPQVGEGFSWAR